MVDIREIREFAAHAHQRTVQVTLHGPDWFLEHFGAFPHSEPLEVNQHEDLALTAGKFPERCRNAALQPGVAGGLGNIASLSQASSAGNFVAKLEAVTGRPALHVGEPEASVCRIAWCTGAAQDYIGAAVSAGADLFVTGEVSEQTVHIAREEGIQFVAAGHHATERYGVQAVGEHLAAQFSIEHCFIDIDNPV